MFDRVVVGVNENPMYLQYLPIVAAAWKRFFPEVILNVAFVTDKGVDDPLVIKMEEYADIELFPLVDGVPSANQSKISRHFLAGYFSDDFCILEDIDTIPLQRLYFENRTSYFVREEGNVLAVGCEVYDTGTFPMSTMGALGKTFSKIINPTGVEYSASVKYLCDNFFDERCFLKSHPHKFSDEYLIRDLLKEDSYNIINVERNIDVYKEWIDRSFWDIDVHKLNSEKYITCNFLRPFDRHLKYMKPIFDYIYGSDSYSRDDIILDAEWGEWNSLDWNGPSYE